MDNLFLLWDWIEKVFSSSAPFLILLGGLIFIHELGHFLVARLFNVKVEVFSLGFGPKILKYKKRETLYCISLLPLGGYVKMFGDNPLKEIPEDQKSRGFLYKKVYQKWLIAFAGPFFNLLFTLIGFFIMALLGVSSLPAKLGDLSEDSSAFQKGFRSGDEILAVNGEDIFYYEELNRVLNKRIGETLSFDIKTEQGTRKTIQAEVQKIKDSNPLTRNKERGSIEGLTVLSQGLKIGVPFDSLAFKKGLRSFDTLLEVGLDSTESLDSNTSSNFSDSKANKPSSSGLKAKSNLKLASSEREDTKEESLQKQYPLDFTSIKFWRELKSLPPSKNYQLQIQREGEVKTLAFELETAQSLLDLGLEPSDLYIEKVGAKTPAERADLKRGDRLLALNEERLKNWEGLLKAVEKSEGESLELSYKRESQAEKLLITPEKIFVEGNMKSRYMLGIVSAGSTALASEVLKKRSVFESVVYSGVQTWKWLNIITTGLVRLVTGEFSMRTMGGPIAIGRVAHNSFSQGFSSFLFIMTLISLNLFLLNLLPIPVLDGGHLLFFSLEGLLGRPLSLKKLLIAQNIGLLFNFGLYGLCCFQ